jgi:hypothetical protein
MYDAVGRDGKSKKHDAQGKALRQQNDTETLTIHQLDPWDDDGVVAAVAVGDDVCLDGGNQMTGTDPGKRTRTKKDQTCCGSGTVAG